MDTSYQTKKNSRSVTNSPDVSERPLVTLSSVSVTNSPVSRSNRITDKFKEESRRMIEKQPKVIVIPAGKSSGRTTKVSSANSSDSSDGKHSPHNRRWNPVHQRPISKGYVWHPQVHNLKTPRASPSLRSLKDHTEGRLNTGSTYLPPSHSLRSFTGSDLPVTSLRPMSDVASVRSLVSIGMGSTDGKRLVIRRVPTSPSELLNIARTPCGLEDDDFSTCSSLSGTISDTDTPYRLRRKYWSNKLQFILACVSYSVGLGNLWRFPYLCYKSGGGVFLIPYFLILLLCSVPLLYMELAVGQLTRRGPISALSKLCPIFKGVGLSSVIVSFFLSTYYNVIIAYTLSYLFSSFRSDPPWQHCNNRWNTQHCWMGSFLQLNKTKPSVPMTPAEEFYTKKILQVSDGVSVFGQMRWELVACLFVVWVIVYFALWKSVRSSGKVLYFTAVVPFTLILLFLGHAINLEGADIGLKYLFHPKLELLLDSKVWVNAAAQNFNSIGIAFGSVLSFASYNKYNNQIIHDTVAVSCINGITSILVAVFAFSTIGNIAWEQQETVENVITDGPGLVFVVYPQALSGMPLAGLWSVLFFFTMLCLGLNSQFAIVEVVVTSIQDGFPNWIKRKLVCHEILVLFVCFISFVIGLPHVSQGGIYFFQLIDYYIAAVSIIYVAFFETMAISWIYGADRLAENIEKMTGHKPGFYFTYCWKFVSPFLLLCIWMFSILDYETLSYENYTYPLWSEILGWLITIATLISVPIFAVLVVLYSEGKTLKEKFLNALQPRMTVCSSSPSDDTNGVHDVKELDTLIEYRVPNCSLNNNSFSKQNHSGE